MKLGYITEVDLSDIYVWIMAVYKTKHVKGQGGQGHLRSQNTFGRESGFSFVDVPAGQLKLVLSLLVTNIIDYYGSSRVWLCCYRCNWRHNRLCQSR